MKVLISFVLCSFFALTTLAQNAGTANTAMTSSEFNQFLQTAHSRGLETLSSENSEDTFTAMFPNSNSYFSTSQVGRMMAAVNKDSGKLALARYLYGRVTDPSNYDRLADQFKSETYRREFVLWVHETDKQPYNTISQR